MPAATTQKTAFAVIILALLVIIAACGWGLFCCVEDYIEANTPPPPVVYPPIEAASGEGRTNGGLTLFSSHALLYDLTEDKVLFKLASDERCAPASLTKMMTVYTALINLADLDAEVTIGYTDLAGLYEANASMAGLQEGDVIPVRDLLYATMLPSGADAANALARAACGSVEEFIAEMNATAASLGMADSHFENVTGLDSDEHYSTAEDLLLLMKTALKNETFREIICTHSYTTVPTSVFTNGIALSSTLSMRLDFMDLEPGPLKGGKTGYTENAGLCLASIAEIGGKEFLLITTGAEGDGRSPQTNILDALDLYSRCK